MFCQRSQKDDMNTRSLRYSPQTRTTSYGTRQNQKSKLNKKLQSRSIAAFCTDQTQSSKTQCRAAYGTKDYTAQKTPAAECFFCGSSHSIQRLTKRHQQ